MLGPCVVVDGRVVGSWRRTLGRRAVDVELDLFEPMSAGARSAVVAAGARYGAFLQTEARAIDGLGKSEKCCRDKADGASKRRQEQ